jgi:hypothetical protein
MEQQTGQGGRWRERAAQFGFWVVLIATLWGLDTLTKIGERDRTGVGLDDFRLYTEQGTSALSALIMVLFVAWWLRRFPVQREDAISTAIGLILGSALFTIGHYGLIVLFRTIVFELNGMEYNFWGGVISNLIFEYQKDLKIYIGMVVIIAAYRELQHRRETTTASQTKRLRVQTGTGEHLLPFEEIDHLAAARNYVSVFAGGREYVVRDTMTNLQQRLAGGRFIRTHRSHIVNLDRITETRSTESGGQIISLQTGKEVPLGRSYQESYRAVMNEIGA